ncbi:hypothetical protein [Nocardia transvalensis]|uniref:hypothetical protein n=1 Tax=Nocardia transvalensis TaxID=37333 RepID=UPI001894D6AE|nr:hypothetical protein [Nocardia transvalensis]MBF6333614.1 hypothetical protein [Nocardia transvalensis]
MDRRVTMVRLAVVLAITVAACTSNRTDLPALNGPVLTGPPGVAKSPEQQATEGATAAITHYYEVLSRVLTGAGDPGELASVAAPPYLDQLQREVGDVKGPDATIAGTVRAGAVSPVKVVAPQDENKAPIPGEAQAEMRVCEDRSGLKVTGKPTDAAVTSSRLRRFFLVDAGWPAPQSQWVIQRQYAMPNTACDKPY